MLKTTIYLSKFLEPTVSDDGVKNGDGKHVWIQRTAKANISF